MGQHVTLKMLLLFEGLVAVLHGAIEPSIVTLEVPIQLALADELLV